MKTASKQAGLRGLAPLLMVLSLVALLLAMALAPRVARAEDAADDDEVQTLYYRPTANPVADRTVHVDVHKLDRDTHEYVKGAHLQILDKETGEVMIEWTSGEDKQQVNRILDVSDENETHVYILHEVSAPEGFEKAEDVEFIVKSVNFETKGEVLSGATTADGEINAEFRNVEGDIETQAFVINLYDAESPSYKEVVEHRTNENESEKTTTTTTENKTEEKKTEDKKNENQKTDEKKNEDKKTEEKKDEQKLAQTDDDTPYKAMYSMAIWGVVLLAAGFYLNLRQKQAHTS